MSHAGKEAVIAVLDGGDFFGEGCLAGQSVRTATATAISESSVMRIGRQEITRKLHAEESFAEFLVSHIVKRNIRMEEDLIDQLFNSTEKRLARTLLLLAHTARATGRGTRCPKYPKRFSQRWSGRPVPRVNFFMNKFRKLGFVEYNATLYEGEQLPPRSRTGRLRAVLPNSVHS